MILIVKESRIKFYFWFFRKGIHQGYTPEKKVVQKNGEWKKGEGGYFYNYFKIKYFYFTTKQNLIADSNF